MNITEQLPPETIQSETPYTIVGAAVIYAAEPISYLPYHLLDAILREHLRLDGLQVGGAQFASFFSPLFVACTFVVPVSQRGAAQKSFENTLRFLGLLDQSIIAVITADDHWHTVRGALDFDKLFLTAPVIAACKKYCVLLSTGKLAATASEQITAFLNQPPGQNPESK